VDRSIARELIEQLNADAARLASRFGLHYASITAERANVTSRYGVCYSDGAIKIRLRHATTGKPLKYSSLVNTLCHELAHLRHFNHGPRFKAFYFEILDYAREVGIYRPRRPGRVRPEARPAPVAPPPSRRPEQLDLFG
jgi:predicted metal-dependent hydrolase